MPSPTLPRLWQTLLLVSMAATLHATLPGPVPVDTGLLAGIPAPEPGITAFLGIPYGAPPVGALRWKAPQPAAAWSGVRQANAFGARAMQSPLFSDMIFRDNGPSEDCLYLNVWTPAHDPAEKLPVMVWIYGGGLEAGGSSEPRQDGAWLATKGVVVVNFNYRLGVFGFFSHPELSAESGHGASGDYGFMDQIAALRWVQRNIAAFGGDPGNVTIFGESAGSWSVSILMGSPLARGLFHKAIGQSGAGMRREVAPEPRVTLAQAEANGVAFGAALGARSLAEMRALPAKTLLEAGRGPAPYKATLVDGYVLPRDLKDIYLAGEQSHVPLLAGWTADETRVYNVFGSKRPTPASFIQDVRTHEGADADRVLQHYPARSEDEAVQSAGDLACDLFMGVPTWTWIELHHRTGGAPVFRYSFDRAVPVPADRVVNGKPATGRDVGAVHASDIVYVFHALASSPGVTWEDADWRLSDAMATYWSNFARTGNPDGKGLPEWPVYGAAGGYPVMHLDVTLQARPETHRDRYLFWSDLK